MKKNPYEVANGKQIARGLQIRAEAIGDGSETDNRSLEFVASTEAEIDMWFGSETLLHDAENVDMTYLETRTSPTLLDHWASKVIGVIEGARLENKELHITARFGRGQLADEIYQDLIDGIRSNASLGYTVQEWTVENADSDDPKYIATKWTPRELSIVTFPADVEAGVIRADRSDFLTRAAYQSVTEQSDSEDSSHRATAEPPTNQTAAEPTEEGTEQQMATHVRTDYDEQAAQILKLTQDFNLPQERAVKAIQERKEYNTYLQEVASEIAIVPHGDGTATAPEQNRDEGLDVEEKDKQRFSFARAITSLFDAREEAGFEMEIINAERERRRDAGMDVRGLTIPQSLLGNFGPIKQRMARFGMPVEEVMHQRSTLVAGTNNVGGDLVAEELRAEDFIDFLYAESAILPYTTMLENLQGNIAIPKQTARITAGWVDETGTAPESNPTFSLVQLQPTDMRVKVPYSRQLNLQSSIGIENLLRQAIARSFAQFLDEQLVYGSGTAPAIKGITGITALGDSTKQLVQYPAAGLDYDSCLKAVSIVGKANALAAGMSWAVSWKFWEQAMKTARLTNGNTPIFNNPNMMGRGEIAGFEAMPSTQIKEAVGSDTDADEAMFGDWSQIIVGAWGGLDIELDDKTDLERGIYNLVAFWTLNAAHMRDETFIRIQRT